MGLKAFIALSGNSTWGFFENLKFLVVIFRLKVNFGAIILGKTSKLNRSKFRVEASKFSLSWSKSLELCWRPQSPASECFIFLLLHQLIFWKGDHRKSILNLFACVPQIKSSIFLVRKILFFYMFSSYTEQHKFSVGDSVMKPLAYFISKASRVSFEDAMAENSFRCRSNSQQIS